MHWNPQVPNRLNPPFPHRTLFRPVHTDPVPQHTELLYSIPNDPPRAPGVPTLDDVLAAVQATHVARLEVASASVSLRATPVPAFEPTTPVTVTPPSAGVTPSFALPSTGVAAPSTPDRKSVV